MPKLRSTYDGRLIFKTSHEGRKAVLVGTIRLQSREISHEKLANTKQKPGHNTGTELEPDLQTTLR